MLVLKLPRSGACMRQHHGFFSHWCNLFEFHLKRRQLNATRFALLVGSSQQAVHGYLVGKSKPPLCLVDTWAAKLGLKGPERQQFVTAAYEAHTPGPIWNRLLELEAEARGLPAPSESIAGAVDALLESVAVVAKLVDILRDVEALFYARTVPLHLVPSKRVQVGSVIREAIVRHGKPPPSPGTSPG